MANSKSVPELFHPQACHPSSFQSGSLDLQNDRLERCGAITSSGCNMTEQAIHILHESRIGGKTCMPDQSKFASYTPDTCCVLLLYLVILEL